MRNPIRGIMILCGFLSLFYLTSSLIFGDVDSAISESELSAEYYRGDGLGVRCYMNLSKNRTFNFRWEGCLGTYDKNEGSYTIENGTLVLSPKHPNIREGGSKMLPTRFLSVKWGNRLYLIPEDEVIKFCNEINQGREPRDDVNGLFYLRRGDEKKPVIGFPDLPRQWRDYLLKEPIDGQVVSVEKGKVAVVSIGKKHGIRAGMLLTATNSKRSLSSQLEVISIEEETAKAKVIYADEKVEVGDKVSTKFH